MLLTLILSLRYHWDGKGAHSSKLTFVVYSQRQSCQWFRLSAEGCICLSREHPQHWNLDKRNGIKPLILQFRWNRTRHTYNLFTSLENIGSVEWMDLILCALYRFRLGLRVDHQACWDPTLPSQPVGATELVASRLLPGLQDSAPLDTLCWHVTVTHCSTTLSDCKTRPQALGLALRAFILPLPLLFGVFLWGAYLRGVFCLRKEREPSQGHQAFCYE